MFIPHVGNFAVLGFHFPSYLVETPFCPVGIWVLVCILVGMPTAQSVTDNPTSCSVHVPGHALSRC